MRNTSFPIFQDSPKMLGKNQFFGRLNFEMKIFKTLCCKGFQGILNLIIFFWHAGWLTAHDQIETYEQMISKTDFKKEVIESTRLALVQFKTEWNGACQIISPIYEELAKSYKGQANFFTVDVEKETGIDNEFGVMELPTILFFKSGEVIDHVTGLTPKNVMITKIENALTSELN